MMDEEHRLSVSECCTLSSEPCRCRPYRPSVILFQPGKRERARERDVHMTVPPAEPKAKLARAYLTKQCAIKAYGGWMCAPSFC
jgi:hypothetical protein